MRCNHCQRSAEPDTRFCEFHLIEHRKTKGKEWAELLQLRKARGYNDPQRYSTDWGTKTALGIYEVITRLYRERGERA